MYEKYFESRGVTLPDPKMCSLPNYLKDVLGNRSKSLSILDIGCGYGNILYGLKNFGFTNIAGIDVSKDAVMYCREQGLNVIEQDVLSYQGKDRYDFVIMSHIIEHLPKEKVIPILTALRENLLSHKGEMFIMVPNAQSNTDCYWAYEDFTHNTLFTGGSLMYVLRQAGFKDIKFIDVDGLCGLDKNSFEYHKRKMLQELYIANKLFWNKVTGSSYHRPSPLIFTWEIKALAS